MLSRRHTLCLAVAAMLAGTTGTALAGQSWFFSRDGAVISGYDPVAYFKEGKPVKGSRDYALMWKGGTWYFSSAENRAAFEMNPFAYAPQYGGYCAYAASRGYTAKTEPEAWRVVDGKLYLNFSLSVREMWTVDIPGNIAKGDANWPAILSQ